MIYMYHHIPKTGGRYLVPRLMHACARAGIPFIWCYDHLPGPWSNEEHIRKLEKEHGTVALGGHACFRLSGELHYDAEKWTIVRDPIERVLSHAIYTWELNEGRDPADFPSDYSSIELFVRQWMLTNQMSKHLRLIDEVEAPIFTGGISWASWHYIRMDEYRAGVERLFESWGLPSMYIEQRDPARTRGRRLAEELSVEDTQQLLDIESWDAQLWRSVSEVSDASI